MRVTLLQENLHKAVSLTSKIVSSKTQLPILGNILLRAKKTTFLFMSTDLETSFVIQIPAKIEKQGEITLPAKTFSELVFSLPAKKVTLEQEKEKVKVACGKIKAEIKGMSAKDFPTIPIAEQKTKGWRIKGKDFVKACSQVVFAASFDETRPVLAGVRLKTKKEQAELVATDGYRLSRKSIVGKFGEERVLIIPAKALLEISRIIGGSETDLLVFPEKKENQVIFLFDNTQVVSRLIEGSFPPFAKIIPQSHQTEAFVNREELVRALKIAAVFARESANIVKLKIENGKLKISANAPQVGTNETQVEAKTKGEQLKIAFNFRFVLEFLNSIDGEEVSLKLNGNLAPAIFAQAGDSSLLHVIMPVRVQKAEE